MAFAGRAKAERRTRDGQTILAFNIAALMRAKKLPDPKSLLTREPSRPQTPDQQWAIMSAMAAAQSRTQH